MTGEGDKLRKRERDTRWEDGKVRQVGMTGEGDKLGKRERDTRWDNRRCRQVGLTGEEESWGKTGERCNLGREGRLKVLYCS
jgi:hypothetical protein